jgi:cation:H+ antiporter
LISSSINLSKNLQIPDLIIGFTIIAIATSLPELFVLINSASNDKYGSDLAYGTILGSNIANISLILGGCILLSKKNSFVNNLTNYKNQIQLIFLSTIIFAYLSLEGFGLAELSFSLLVILFILSFTNTELSSKPDKTKAESFFIKDLFVIIFSIASIWIGSNLLVSSGIELIEKFNATSSQISSVFLALSTSAPEIFTSLIAILKFNKSALVIGNVIGSNILNIGIFSIIGITYNLSYFDINIANVLLLVACEAYVLILLYSLYKEKSINNKYGVILILFYIIFIYKL